MPSGLTHMMLSRKSLDELSDINDDASSVLDSQRGPFIMGSVAPDLPYMTLMDVNVFTNRKNIADDLHYQKTNLIPLNGLKFAKDLYHKGNLDEARSIYAFYSGFSSHVIADGIIHPYVRDSVGDYEVAKDPHRALEMKLDVFIAEHFFKANANEISFHEELSWMKDCANQSTIFDSFSSQLKTVHGHNVHSDEIKTWLKTMDMVFDIATGSFPQWYQNLMGNAGYALKDLETLRSEREKLCNLRMPIDAIKHNLKSNYMGKENVSFFDDVLPKYFNYYPNFLDKTYNYVFGDGKLPEELLPEINLDTGRLVANNDLTNKPAILEIIA